MQFHQRQQQQQRQPPRSGGTRSGYRLQNSVPDATLFAPPATMFILGGLGILWGLVSTIWQIITSFSAFQHIIVTGSIFLGLGARGQAAALPIINVICGLIAISFQIAILYLVFRIDRNWKENKAQGLSRGMIWAAKHTAIEIVQHVPIVMVWGALGFIADTIGDYTFISLYSDFWFVLFMYGAALYASSTIMLVSAIEYWWAGQVAWEKWKAYKVAVAMLAAEAVKATRRKGGR